MSSAPAPLRPFLQRAAQLTALVDGQALLSAQLAAQLGEPELARALLARTGGLLDSSEALRLLTRPVPQLLLDQARETLGAALQAPGSTPGEREMFVRGLAAFLLRPAAPTPAPLPNPLGPAVAPSPEPLPLESLPLESVPPELLPLESLPPGLSVAPVLPEETRWLWGVARALASAGELGQDHVTLACAGWGTQQGALMTLRARYGEDVVGEHHPVTVLSLEDVVRLLSAAWSWDLPRLASLLGGPLLLGGLQMLSPAQLLLVSGLLQDAASVFGWRVLGLPGVERMWPAAFAPLAGPGVQPPVRVPVFREQGTQSLAGLAARLRPLDGDTLVVLPSRASAARLVGLLPGSVLYSSSLCAVHLGDQLRALQACRERGERLTVVATTLPPTLLGEFDRVWQPLAPLPHLAEALPLCRPGGDFRVVGLTDVATPTAWNAAAELTAALLAQGADLGDAEVQRRYDRELDLTRGAADHGGWSGSLQGQRERQDFASLASELLVRGGASVPVFVPYGPGAAPVLEQVRRSAVFPGSALRYAAWLTVSEAERAVQRGQAQALGWAFLWQGSYDARYGLAAEAVQGAVSRE